MSKQQMTQVRATANLPQGNGDDDCSWFLHVMNNCINSEVLFLLYAQEKYYNNESGGYFEGAL